MSIGWRLVDEIVSSCRHHTLGFTKLIIIIYFCMALDSFWSKLFPGSYFSRSNKLPPRTGLGTRCGGVAVRRLTGKPLRLQRFIIIIKVIICWMQLRTLPYHFFSCDDLVNDYTEYYLLKRTVSITR